MPITADPHLPGRIALAPMEGLADDVLRAVLTRTGGYDWCVSEFVRVSNTVLPLRAFRRIAPEVDKGGRTDAGTPVRLQLMGSGADLMGENAARAAGLLPYGIDLNFGCPTPLVNRHCAGASLLDFPEQLRAIMQAVRQAVPPTMRVSAKMRLGIDDPAIAPDCARALVDGGAEELVVHARTRADMYKFPARWEWLARVREAVDVPVIANGDIFSVDDWARCHAISGCDDVMLGRGAVADPLLVQRLRGAAASVASPDDWPAVAPLIWAFWQGVCLKLEARFAPGRIKHWLLLMQGRNPQADALLLQVRPLRTAADITRVLLAELERHLPGEASRVIVYRSSPTGSRNTDGGAVGESNDTPLAA